MPLLIEKVIKLKFFNLLTRFNVLGKDHLVYIFNLAHIKSYNAFVRFRSTLEIRFARIYKPCGMEIVAVTLVLKFSVFRMVHLEFDAELNAESHKMLNIDLVYFSCV